MQACVNAVEAYPLINGQKVSINFMDVADRVLNCIYAPIMVDRVVSLMVAIRGKWECTPWNKSMVWQISMWVNLEHNIAICLHLGSYS